VAPMPIATLRQMMSNIVDVPQKQAIRQEAQSGQAMQRMTRRGHQNLELAQNVCRT